jgi:tetratricopeptide (TPR) repeat protein
MSGQISRSWATNQGDLYNFCGLTGGGRSGARVRSMADMTEDDYLNELSRRVREAEAATVETMRLVDEAVALFPRSVKLWCQRGDLIQLGSAGVRHTLEDARASYERALAIDPDNAEPLESLGHFFDAVDPQPILAESYLRQSTERGGTRYAFVSLAELYLATGRPAEALALLSPARCPHHDHADIAYVRDEAAKVAKG